MSEPTSVASDPVAALVAMVDRVLELAESWVAWDGRPIEVEVEGEEPRIYTPHKAIRRVADHMVDHLAQVEARLARSPALPDHWHASAITTPSDLAPFGADDLAEARSRLRRLAQIFELRLRSLSHAEVDAPAADEWSIREIALHVSESVFYADAVGDLRH